MGHIPHICHQQAPVGYEISIKEQFFLDEFLFFAHCVYLLHLVIISYMQCVIHRSMQIYRYDVQFLNTMSYFYSLVNPRPLAASTRVGHAYAKYADYAHMRNMRMRIENLIHIFHIQREKTSLFKRQQILLSCSIRGLNS